MTEKMTTVGELILALATCPLDAKVTIGDPFIDLGIEVGDEYHTVYHEYEGVTPYERPDIIREVVERNHPGDDHATAQEFLDWLRTVGIGLVNAGHGYGELDSPVLERQRATLAQRFAERPNA